MAEFPMSKLSIRLWFVILAVGCATAGSSVFAQVGFAIRHSNSEGGALRGVAATMGRVVAVGDNGTILSSATGASWVACNSGTTARLNAITYADHRFVAVGDGGVVLRSDDGIAWSPAEKVDSTEDFFSVTYGQSRYVVVGKS